MPDNQEIVQYLLAEAQVTINGPGDWDIQVIHPWFYKRVLREGVLGFGEAYMDGWWEVKKLDELFDHLISASLHEKVKTWKIAPYILKAKILNAGKE